MNSEMHYMNFLGEKPRIAILLEQILLPRKRNMNASGGSCHFRNTSGSAKIKFIQYAF